MMFRRNSIFIIILLLLLAAPALAQSGSQTTQEVVAGGGGTTSAPGAIQVEGTIGQSVTGMSSGGPFKLESGFWAGAAALAPANISVDNLSGIYGDTLNLKATLSASNANLSGKLILFSLNGTNVGTATTDAQGLATLNNVSLGGINAGTYATGITAEFAGDAQLTASNSTGQLTIAKADPTLSVTGGSVTYDGQPHPATASATGINNEALGPITLLYNGATSIPVNAGSYAVVATFAGNQNYNSAMNNQQNIIIGKANQAITFSTLPNKTFGEVDFLVSATTSVGLTVGFAASGQCTVTGATVHLTGAGSCTITASQTGDSNYNAATPVPQTFNISSAAVTITLSNLSQIYDGTPKSPTAVTTPSSLNVTFTYSQNGSPVTFPINAGNYDVTATISAPNYQGSATGILVITKATPTITWNNPANIVYGTPLSGTQLNATANVAGTFTYNLAASTVLNVGTHQLSVTFTPSDTANYTTATANVPLTVDQVTAAAFNFDSATYTVDEGAGRVIITVNRTGNSAGAASVNYTVTDNAGLTDCNVFNGIASSRCDYATGVGTLHFAAGETSKTIFIPLVDDSYTEGSESLSITLSNAAGENLGAVSTATITITDNETAAGPNPIDETDFFVREHYIDFLGREPEPGGFDGWRNTLNNCAAGDKTCDRVQVSSGFFRSEEFQRRGYFIYRFYSAIQKVPLYSEFMPDFARVSGFLSPEQLETNKAEFVNEFMNRPEFQHSYGSLADPTAYVDALLQTVGLQNHPTRGAWIAGLTNGTMTRAQVLRALVESSEVYQKYFNEAFVVMQYFGYLRRDPDILYLQWIQTLDQTGDYRMMINGFINSAEYRQRFGQ